MSEMVYSTRTPARQHVKVVEMEYDTGYRNWSAPMPESKVNAYIDSFPGDYAWLSDIDCSMRCWCVR